MHALLAYLNGASNCPRGRARQDEGLEVLNVLMRSTRFVRDARGQVRSTEPECRRLGRRNAKSHADMPRAMPQRSA